MNWKAEVIRACAWGMSRLRKDLAALEYNERRIISVLAFELELGLGTGFAPELWTTVVVEDMEKGGYHMSHGFDS